MGLLNYWDGMHNWAYILARVQGAAGSGYQEDWLAMSADLGAAAGKTIWYARNQSEYSKAQIKQASPTVTWIVDLAMVIVQAMDFLNGFWVPDDGDCFTHGQEQLENAYYSFLLAYPDDGQWSGDKEQDYAKRNLAQQDQTQKMQKLDADLQAIVHRQAQSVESAHAVVAVTQFGLMFAQGIALALFLSYADPVVGQLISFRFQIVVAVSAVAGVFIQEMLTMHDATSHAAQVERLAAKYSEVAGSGQPSVASTAIGFVPRVQPVEPSFGAGPGNVRLAELPDRAAELRLASAGASAAEPVPSLTVSVVPNLAWASDLPGRAANARRVDPRAQARRGRRAVTDAADVSALDADAGVDAGAGVMAASAAPTGDDSAVLGAATEPKVASA